MDTSTSASSLQTIGPIELDHPKMPTSRAQFLTLGSSLALFQL